MVWPNAIARFPIKLLQLLSILLYMRLILANCIAVRQFANYALSTKRLKYFTSRTWTELTALLECQEIEPQRSAIELRIPEDTSALIAVLRCPLPRHRKLNDTAAVDDCL